MAGMRFEKNSKEWQMFTDFWSLCQKFWVAENSDEYWNNFICAANQFCDKHKGSFPQKLAMAILETKEEERKLL